MDIAGIGGAYSSFMTDQAQMQKNIDSVNSFEATLERAMDEKNDKELKEACRDFESYFIQLLFKEMRNTINRSDGIIPRSNADDIFEDMLFEEISKSAAEGKGIGVADMMYRQLSRGDVYRSIPVQDR